MINDVQSRVCLRQGEERPPEVVAALLPSPIRTMLAAFVEAMAEQRSAKT